MQKFQNLKAFENKKFKMAKKAELFLERAENIVRKGENAGYQHFLTMLSRYLYFFLPNVVKTNV